MATAVSKSVASSSTYTGAPEPMPRRYEDGYHRPAAGVYMTGIPGYAPPECGYTMPAPGFTSLSGLRGRESLGGRSRGSGRSANRSLTRSEINEALREATSKNVGDLTQEIRAKLEPLIPPQASPTIVGVSPHRVQANGVSLIRPYSCNTRILPYPAVSCRILLCPAVSCRILPYPAVSCRILPYPAVSCRICRILPYPAFPAVSCRMPVTETLTLTLTLTLTVILTWSFSYW